MSKILFTEFKIDKGFIEFKYTEIDGESGNIYFKLTPAIKPNEDLIAIALSTLCGRKYSEIYYELNVSSKTIREISNFTLANVTVKKEKSINKKRTLSIFNKRKINTTLNFSGGFDSLAAKYLMPDDTKLVSMDFGGKFERERIFFNKFNTCVVSTNLLETSLRHNSWSFMGIASILFSDYLKTDYHTFGSILEAGPNNFTKSPIASKNISFPPFKAAGMENAPYVLGLTEVGTVKVLAHFKPELVAESLDSLANPGEEKRYRKQVLATIYEQKNGVNLNLNIVTPPAAPHFKFGQNFAADFLSFYIIKNAGLEIALYTISEIPEEVIDTSNKLTLSFYEKINPNFLTNFPKPLLSNYLSKLGEVGILPYTAEDWEEFRTVRNILSKYYEIK